MLPNKICESITCLESLVKVRSDCDSTNCADFYVEDIEGVDIARLSEAATVNSPSGLQFGRDLVNLSAREMLSDVEFLIGSGYSLVPTFGELCSTCSFGTVYRAGTKTKVTNTVGTKYSVLRIGTMQVLTNFTGTAILIIDDTTTQKQYTVDLQSGVIANLVVDYSTEQKAAYVYMADATIGLAQVNCTGSNGCGCGSQNRNAAKVITYSGMLGATVLPYQYGFLICSSVQCSSDLMVCDLIKQTPKIFGIALFYKTGAKYYSNVFLSTRNNRTAGQDEEKKAEMREYYEGLYQTRLQGNRTTKGIYGIVSKYLSQRNDKCVVCDGNTKTAWMTG